MLGLSAIVVVVYGVAAAIVAAFAVAQAHLLWCRWIGRLDLLRPPLAGEDLPFVTVQLPVFNERRVVTELVGVVGKLDWPRDRLEIQLLDDSDDETVTLGAAACARLRADGIDAQHIRRLDRRGFKAGALAYGLEAARGELVAIFDADFRPPPSFLRDAVACFDDDVGMVQARWSHPHADASWLTRVQAFQLDNHFTLEQGGRGAGGLLLSFNGTGGVWRRRCIEEAGGWRADSLTEDLDLSYRAQLRGWRLRYVDGLEAPAELPGTMGAVRTQQFRWMKGGAEVARLLLGDLWASDQPLRRKLQGSAHMLGSSAFIGVFLLCLTVPFLPPLMRWGPGWFGPAIAVPGLLLQVSLVILSVAYLSTCLRRGTRPLGSFVRFLRCFPVLLSVSAGMSLHNGIAVIEGWAGRRSPFVRTPKVGEGGAGLAAYAPVPVPPVVWAELGLALWCGLGALLAMVLASWVSAAFLASQAIGFAVFAGTTLTDARADTAPMAAL